MLFPTIVTLKLMAKILATKKDIFRKQNKTNTS